MGKKSGDDKIEGIGSASKSAGVIGPASIGEVDSIAPSASVTGITRTDSIIRKRQTTRIMSLEEREGLFKMIREETDLMFGKSAVPEAHRKVVQNAVQMAIDAGLVKEEGGEEESR